MYSIEFKARAREDLEKLKRTEPKAFKKVLGLLDEIADHPRLALAIPNRFEATKLERGVDVLLRSTAWYMRFTIQRLLLS